MGVKNQEMDFAWLQVYMEKAGISEPLLRIAFKCPNCNRYIVLSDVMNEVSTQTEAPCPICRRPIRAITLFQTIRRIIGYDDFYANSF